LIAPDTSVLIAGFDPAHESHDAAQSRLVAVRGEERLLAHTIAETVAVLTAPGPYGIEHEAVLRYLDQFLDRRPVAPVDVRATIGRATTAGVVGGAIYDALIGLTALEHGATLVSLDRRAAATYRRCGVDFELL